MKMLGNHVDGAYAQWVVAPARELMNLPAELPLEDSCIIADALTTPYHAVVRRGQVRPADRVLVLGCGGVGLGVVQMARAAGAYVAAVDLSDTKLALAEKLGAVACFNPQRESNLNKAVTKALGGMAEVCFEAIGNPTTLAQAMAAVEAGGRVVVVGYCEHDVPLKASRVMFRELDVVGSLGCRPVDYPRVIEMVRRGSIQLDPLVSHRFPLESIHQGLDMLRQGQLIRGIVIP
jgi:2-desacetyl-2-hydroxyethyl bacteriochlorophyllide A dehydrogenase